MAQDKVPAAVQGDAPGVVVPQRFIPVPPLISPEAQAYLAHPMIMVGDAPDPVKDKAAWLARNDQARRMTEAMLKLVAQDHPGDLATHQLSRAAIYEITPRSFAEPNSKRAILYIHGGGFTMGGGQAAVYAAMQIADIARMRTFSVDYRMPPEDPYPAAVDDSVEAYRWLLAQGYKAGNIAIYGPSAGGNLAAAAILKARDSGLPLPGACVLHTPATDLTRSGDSFHTLKGIDPILTGGGSGSEAVYAPGRDLKDPYISPLFGDFSKGFPPTILTSGTRDLLLSSTVAMHRALRRAGVKAELDIYDGMPHGGFAGKAPEDEEILDDNVRFIDENLGEN